MTKQEKFKTLLEKTYHLNILDAPDLSEFENAEELKEYLQERICEHEIIYHYKAMEFLKENDCSLRHSLSLAHDLGFSLEKLNSETLATLVVQDCMSEELNEIDLEQFFD